MSRIPHVDFWDTHSFLVDHKYQKAAASTVSFDQCRFTGRLPRLEPDSASCININDEVIELSGGLTVWRLRQAPRDH